MPLTVCLDFISENKKLLRKSPNNPQRKANDGMRVEKDWWKNFFDFVYLITDARSIDNINLTRREVDLLENYLKLSKNEAILDLCGGQGRHSLELARLGYKNLTVLDYSDYLVKLGKRKARNSGFKIKFVRKDARFTGFKEGSYSTVFMMANSFGYFPQERENLAILKEIYRILKRNGKLLLDLTDVKHLKRTLSPLSWHEANKDIIVCRKRSLEKEMIKAREIVISRRKGVIRDKSYCERIYTRNKIKGFLKKAGFKTVSVKKDSALEKEMKGFGLLSSRIFIKGIKT